MREHTVPARRRATAPQQQRCGRNRSITHVQEYGFLPLLQQKLAQGFSIDCTLKFGIERRAVTGCHRNQWYNVAHAGHCAMHGSFSTLWFRQLTCRGGKDRSSDDKLIPRLASRRRLRTCSGRARETAGNRIMRAAMCCRCVLACMLDEGVCM
jgi:hypothetical protein